MPNTAFPNLGYELPIIAGWHDESWGNDACARLVCDANPDLFLWCDYAEPAERETGPNTKRFTLIVGEYGNPDDQTILMETDDIAEIRRALAEL